MKKLTSVVLLLAALVIHSCRAARPGQVSGLNSQREAPRWPSSYSVNYVFSLPYTGEIQPNAINYTVAFYKSAGDESRDNKVRMETLRGVNVVIGRSDVEYEITPRLDVQICRVNTDIEEGGASSLTALPDISGWDYQGNAIMNGIQADLWQYERHHESKHVLYKFFISADGDPIRFHMIGNDAFSGSHFDEWVVDYIDYKPGKPDRDLFDRPRLCDHETALKSRHAAGRHSPGVFRMMQLTPKVHYGGEDVEYDAFLTTGHGRGRKHASLLEYRHRLGLFKENSMTIQTHNAAGKSYTMAMNKFGDWTREEFLAVMLPKHGKKARNDNFAEAQGLEHHKKLEKHEFPYQPMVDVSRIPSTVDWRGTGADSGVKDQADCGSCWAFGSVGALESAWFLATGHAVKFSEQQVMDCSWGYVPDREDAASACDGGDAYTGVGHVVEAGGVAFLHNYQYLGQNDYCREDSRDIKGGKFAGFARIPRFNDSALMEAVYTRGPITVSLDASQDSFTFYSSGVYYDTQCMWKPADLDHSMMLVGYGTDSAGDYWLIKNSWSTHWGDNGYIKVARDGRGCGASTDAMYAVVDGAAAMAAVGAAENNKNTKQLEQ